MRYTLDNQLRHVAERLNNTSGVLDAIAEFRSVQILDLARTKIEVFIEANEYWLIHYGKNTDRIRQRHRKNLAWAQPTTVSKEGLYYYWYTIPLVNYYHTLLDGVGSLVHYMRLRKTNPDIVLLLNCSPRPKGGVTQHPPFVTELLDLLDIRYEFTDPAAVYERVVYGAPLGISNGKRCRPPGEQYDLLRECIRIAKMRAPAAPSLSEGKVYISRRAHANPLNNRKHIVGEDNTIKRGLTNEDAVVEILTQLGYDEIFGENLTLAEKIVVFNTMRKYISTAGAGVANILWTMPNRCSVGGIHTPGFPFPSNNHATHICTGPEVPATIDCYKGKVLFEDPAAGAKNYNSPWYINNLAAFREWAERI